MRAMDIREIRRRLGLTQDELALRLGTTQATVSRWETDNQEPRGPARIVLSQLAEEAARRPDPATAPPSAAGEVAA